MCINPSHIWVERGPANERVPVPCGDCWRCKKNRIDDYVGRSLAEAATSQRVCTITLTYAPRDDLADKVLHPRHFQLFMKLLRRSGHLVRYLVAGEYGDLRGRAHFHAILFFEHFAEARPSDAPFYRPEHLADPFNSQPFSDQIPQMRMSHIREWPHGHVNVDWNADEKSIRYVCKYLLSDDKNRAWFSVSKYPPLGNAWFMQKAEVAKDLGVLPATWTYTPPGATRDRPYYLSGASRRDFLNAITQDPADKDRMSEWTRKTFEKHERARLMDEINSLPAEVQEQAFIERIERQEEQQRLMRFSRELREAGNLDDLVAQSSDGILRLKGDKWTPNTKD